MEAAQMNWPATLAVLGSLLFIALWTAIAFRLRVLLDRAERDLADAQLVAARDQQLLDEADRENSKLRRELSEARHKLNKVKEAMDG